MNHTTNSNNWIDDIDDIDSFLDEVIAINEQSFDSSPLLNDFCETISLAKEASYFEEKVTHSFAIEVTEDELDIYTHELTKISENILNDFLFSFKDNFTDTNTKEPLYSFESQMITPSYSYKERSLSKAA